MGLRKLAATALLLLVLFNLVSAPTPRLPSIAERYCLNSPFMSHPASWYAIASQIDSFEPPVINSPANGSTFDYETQPIDLEVLVHGNAAAYGVAVQEAATTTQLGTTNNSATTRFPLPSLTAGTHSLQVQATASLQLCGLHHSATQTTPLSLTITKSTPSLSITITPGTTVAPGTETHATCTSSTLQAVPQLRRDGTPVTNPDVAALPLGTYDYTCSATETQNYTSAVAAPVTLVVDTRTPTTTTVTINGVSTDTTITYEETAALAATTTAGSLTLYLNGIPVTNPSTLTLAAGTYNVTAINPGDADYFASSATHWLTINKATPTLMIAAMPASTVTYGTETTVSCAASTPQVTPALTRDLTAASNPEVRTLGGGSYAYACASAATQNYTAATATPLTLTVNRATPTLTLTINGADADQAIDSGATATITATLSTAGSVQITENSASIASGPSPQTVARTPSVGTYNYTATFAGNANYTAASASHLLTVRDLTAPVASGLTWTYANGSMGTAGYLTWTTTEPANSTVYYGNTSGAYTNTLTNTTSSAAHNQSLANLDANTTYYYLIQSCDTSGNCANTTENMFTTPPAFELIASSGLDTGVTALASFGGLLYVGTTASIGGQGRILTTTAGTSFTPVYTASDRKINTFGILDSKLYAGTGLTYGQLLRRNTDGTWTNLVNFTESKQIEAIAEYYYPGDGNTYRYLGMWNGSMSGQETRIHYNILSWGNDAVWDIYNIVHALRVASFAVLGDQIYAGLYSVNFDDDMWCNRGYLVGCTAYRLKDPRGTARMRLLAYNNSLLLEGSAGIPAAFQNTTDGLNWQDTLSANAYGTTLAKYGTKVYGALYYAGGRHEVYESTNAGAVWKQVFVGSGMQPALAEYNGKLYFGTSNADYTQGQLYRST
ncbi:Ig-like domain repeat protein [Candidatus Micrarchaeota archaeon]|nr:Ig-like domain repeat protein [Candidatus Micrarchaeota archaeon]